MRMGKAYSAVAVVETGFVWYCSVMAVLLYAVCYMLDVFGCMIDFWTTVVPCYMSCSSIGYGLIDSFAGGTRIPTCHSLRTRGCCCCLFVYR